MSARKRFGQHFLIDKQSLHYFRLAIRPHTNDHLIEIGPGLGALTDYLIGTTQNLQLIEIDRNLIPLLQQKYGHNATIYQADALRFDFKLLNHTKKIRIVGNLPYNISTPLLFHLFDYIDIIEDMHFLLQQEIVDRLCARPNTPHYGRLSVMTQLYCSAIKLITVPPTAFMPPPKVMSAFVRLIPHPKPWEVNSITQLKAIVGDAFNYRRKTLSNSLKRWINPQQLELLNIDPRKRAEQLSVEDYIRISNQVAVD